ncbi:MAG: CBS domain-containing protein [Pseudonocardiaceae bacterium]
MRARDLATPFPTVRSDTPALEATRLLAAQDLPGLIVVDDAGRPMTILPGTQVLRMVVPPYVQDDPALARVIDEAAADVFMRGVGNRTVAELLPREHWELPVVGPDVTVLEIAAAMARSRIPLAAVASDDEPMIGAITLDALLDRMLGT